MHHRLVSKDNSPHSVKLSERIVGQFKKNNSQCKIAKRSLDIVIVYYIKL